MKFRTSLSSLLLVILVCSSNSQTTKTIAALTDEEAAEFLLLKPTIRKWLRGEKVWKRFYELSNDGFRFEPAELDLNKDGRKELLIRSGCAAVGNCQFWVFRKTAHGYQMILKTLPGSVQTYRLLRHRPRAILILKLAIISTLGPAEQSCIGSTEGNTRPSNVPITRILDLRTGNSIL